MLTSIPSSLASKYFCLTLSGSPHSLATVKRVATCTAEAVDPAAEPEHLANLRLTYVQGSAAYYLPMWEYTIDEGPAALGDGDDVDQTLHTFSAYYVPAVELDGIDVLKNK